MDQTHARSDQAAQSLHTVCIGSKRRFSGTIRWHDPPCHTLCKARLCTHLPRQGSIAGITTQRFPGTGNTPLASLFEKNSSPGLRDPECDRHRWMGEIMLRHFVDSISRWFLSASLEGREEYLAQAKTIDELERRMRDTDRWLGP
ncbi:hypothetical protein [Paraburkholderia sp. 2C]|jgi:hypothetical protein